MRIRHLPGIPDGAPLDSADPGLGMTLNLRPRRHLSPMKTLLRVARAFKTSAGWITQAGRMAYIYGAARGNPA